MKRLALLLLALSPFLLSSCFEILEEIYLQKDGRGTYLYTVDMSAIMDESMKELLANASEEDGVENSLDGIELDTVMYFKDTNPDEIAELSNPGVFERAFTKVQMSDSEDKMLVQFGFDFEDVSEIDYFLEHLDELSGDDMQGGEMGKGLLLSSSGAKMFSRKGKKLSRLSNPNMGDEFNDEDMSMLSMLMETATFTTIYYLPGKVKKTTIPGAVIDGKTLTVETSMLDLVNGEATMDGWVMYKR